MPEQQNLKIHEAKINKMKGRNRQVYHYSRHFYDSLPAVGGTLNKNISNHAKELNIITHTDLIDICK